MRFLLFNVVVVVAIVYLATGGTLTQLAADPLGETIRAADRAGETAKRVGVEAKELATQAIQEEQPLPTEPEPAALPPAAEVASIAEEPTLPAADPAVAERRAEVLAKGSVATDAPEYMSPGQRAGELNRLADDMELFAARMLSR